VRKLKTANYFVIHSLLLNVTRGIRAIWYFPFCFSSPCFHFILIFIYFKIPSQVHVVLRKIFRQTDESFSTMLSEMARVCNERYINKQIKINKSSERSHTRIPLTFSQGIVTPISEQKLLQCKRRLEMRNGIIPTTLYCTNVRATELNLYVPSHFCFVYVEFIYFVAENT
jgi:hypothetical protein